MAFFCVVQADGEDKPLWQDFDFRKQSSTFGSERRQDAHIEASQDESAVLLVMPRIPHETFIGRASYIIVPPLSVVSMRMTTVSD